MQNVKTRIYDYPACCTWFTKELTHPGRFNARTLKSSETRYGHVSGRVAAAAHRVNLHPYYMGGAAHSINLHPYYMGAVAHSINLHPYYMGRAAHSLIHVDYPCFTPAHSFSQVTYRVVPSCHPLNHEEEALPSLCQCFIHTDVQMSAA